MAKIQVIRYKCDVCKKEFENEKDIKNEDIPCYSGEGNCYLSSTKVDLCETCSKKIREVIYNNFAEISDYYGLFIKKKYENE